MYEPELSSSNSSSTQYSPYLEFTPLTSPSPYYSSSLDNDHLQINTSSILPNVETALKFTLITGPPVKVIIRDFL